MKADLVSAAKSYLLRWALKGHRSEPTCSTLARALANKLGETVLEADAIPEGGRIAVKNITSVAYAATVTPVVTTGADLVLNISALTGALTLAAPTGTPSDGQKLTVRFIQDGTGSRVITYNSAFAFGSDITAALDPSAAGSKWERVFEWNAADSKWRAVGIARGF